MNTVNPAAVDEAAILRALQASKAAAAAGRMSESEQLLVGAARRAPDHPAVLNELGVRMMGRGSASEAHALFVRATTADPRHPSLVGQPREQSQGPGPAHRGARCAREGARA